MSEVSIVGIAASVLALIGTVAVAYIQSKTSAKVTVAEARVTLAEGKAKSAADDLSEMKAEVAQIRADVARLSSVLGIAIKYAHELRATHPNPGSWPVDLYPYV